MSVSKPHLSPLMLVAAVRAGLGAGDRLVPGTMSDQEHTAWLALDDFFEQVKYSEQRADAAVAERQRWEAETHRLEEQLEDRQASRAALAEDAKRWAARARELEEQLEAHERLYAACLAFQSDDHESWKAVIHAMDGITAVSSPASASEPSLREQLEAAQSELARLMAMPAVRMLASSPASGSDS